MQSLWSRAGQARHCGCRGCLQAAGGMIRQSTTRVARRKPTFGEVFTAFYMSIMGTAAMLDAKHKDERRRDLMRQIKEVKADLERLTYTSTETLSDPTSNPPPGNIHNRRKGAWNGSRHRPSHLAEFFDSLGDDSTWEKIQPHSETLNEWWRTSGMPQLEGNIARRKETNYDFLQEQILLEEADPSIFHRLPRDVGKQATATTHFIYDLLSNAGLLHLRMNAGALRHTLDRLSKHRDDPEKCAAVEKVFKQTDEAVQDPDQRALRDLIARNRVIYPQSGFPRSRDAWTHISRQMNESIRAVLGSSQGLGKTASQEDVRRQVVRICHIIMSSPCPPNVHTLSTLLLGFDRMGQHGLANAVIVQLLYRNSFEPTEQTIVCLLKHYKEIGNLSRFNSIIQRCTAYSPERTFRIRRKHVDELFEDASSMRWAKRNDVTAHGEYVYERAWFSNATINAILDGLLSFDCIQQAVRVFVECWRRGVRMGADNLHQVLDQCIYALNEDAAYRIVATVFAQPDYIVRNIDARQRDAFIAKLQYLLDICGMNVSAANSLSQRSFTDSTTSIAREARQQTIQTLVVRRKLDVTQGLIDDTTAVLSVRKVAAEPIVKEADEGLSVAQEQRRLQQQQQEEDEEEEEEAAKAILPVTTSEITRKRVPRSVFIRGPGLAPGPFETSHRDALKPAAKLDW